VPLRATEEEEELKKQNEEENHATKEAEELKKHRMKRRTKNATGISADKDAVSAAKNKPKKTNRCLCHTLIHCLTCWSSKKGSVSKFMFFSLPKGAC
jgi:hypothetical protein